MAIPIGVALFTFLFARIGTRIIAEIVNDGLEGVSGLEAVILGIVLVIAGIAIAIMVVVAIVAPVFVVLPMLGTGFALRVSGAGLIMRTLWLMLAALAVLFFGFGAVFQALDVRTEWWMWPIVVALAGFAGRFIVEVWEPRRAAVRTPVAVGRRWVVLGVVWMFLIVIAVVVGTTLALVVVR